MDLIATHTTPALRPPVHEGRPKGDRQRRLLVALVAANPGVHILRAASLLGLNWNTCLHHVRRLEGAGQITVRKVNGRVCLFDRSAGAASHRIGDLLLRDERNARLAGILIGTPGVNQKSLAGRMGIAASVVHYRLVRLEEAGLVQRVNHGREVCVYPTEALEVAFAAHDASGLVPAQPWTEDGAPASPDGIGAETPVGPFGDGSGPEPTDAPVDDPAAGGAPPWASAGSGLPNPVDAPTHSGAAGSFDLAGLAPGRFASAPLPFDVDAPVAGP